MKICWVKNMAMGRKLNADSDKVIVDTVDNASTALKMTFNQGIEIWQKTSDPWINCHGDIAPYSFSQPLLALLDIFIK